jgi:hypothetical protein
VAALDHAEPDVDADDEQVRRQEHEGDEDEGRGARVTPGASLSGAAGGPSRVVPWEATLGQRRSVLAARLTTRPQST